MHKERTTGIFVDIEKDFYKKVKIHCVTRSRKVKEFVMSALKEAMRNDKQSA